MTKKKIYLASSWRNEYQPDVLAALRADGHEVYDFRNPSPGDIGFSWSAIDPKWKEWTPEQFREALKHPLSQNGHSLDQTAMAWCNTGVLLLPSGSSAHLEAGWLAGQLKPTIVYAPALREPELMYKTFELVPASYKIQTFCLTLQELLDSVMAAKLWTPLTTQGI